jgi:hypothetical protein
MSTVLSARISPPSNSTVFFTIVFFTMVSPKPVPCASAPARSTLAKFFEDMRQIFGGDANAGIGYGDFYGLINRSHRQRNAALSSKLHRIAPAGS